MIYEFTQLRLISFAFRWLLHSKGGGESVVDSRAVGQEQNHHRVRCEGGGHGHMRQVLIYLACTPLLSHSHYFLHNPSAQRTRERAER